MHICGIHICESFLRYSNGFPIEKFKSESDSQFEDSERNSIDPFVNLTKTTDILQSIQDDY
ncbi:hypothetical protein V1477_002209 [Vespula maculifrons]|uniref:Uncharacterized protein n=1 Tax=Vespula maculifrons TaxID=7453 RepID=A0ABD2CX01_VESMC